MNTPVSVTATPYGPSSPAGSSWRTSPVARQLVDTSVDVIGDEYAARGIDGQIVDPGT